MNTAVMPTHDAELSRIVSEQTERLFAGLITKDLLAAAEAGVWPAGLWEQLADAAMPDALLPEQGGGPGMAPADVLAIVRRAGFHAAPVPLGETMLARALWFAVGSGDDETPWSGEPLSLAQGGPDTPLALRSEAGAVRLSGVAARVPWATQARALLVYAHDAHGNGWFVLAPTEGLQRDARVNLAKEPRETVHFDDLALPASAARPAKALGAHGLRAWGALLRANQMAGAMDRCLAFALQYAGEREQFGRTISKFPAVQDMLAGAAGQIAAASAAVALANARWPLDARGLHAPSGPNAQQAFWLACAIAKARTGEAAGHVAAACHQVHGAMGFTQEHPLHYSTRRLWSWRDEFGNEAFWQHELGRWACAGGGAALWPAVTAL